MYYVYVLKSKVRDEIYIGSTHDIIRRLREHNDGKEISTKRYVPWEVAYYEAYRTEQMVRLREKRLKSHGNAIRELKKRSGLLKSGAGFTLLELLVVMGITMLLGASAIGYSRTGEEALNLQLSVQKVLSDVNQATSYALSSPARRGSSPLQYYCGFGIHFDQGSESYKVFGDVKPTGVGLKCSDSDRRYVQGTDDVLYESTLKHSKIDSVTSDVLFIPPDPIRYVNGVTSTSPVEIIIRGRGIQPTSSVCINSIGQATIKRDATCL